MRKISNKAKAAARQLYHETVATRARFKCNGWQADGWVWDTPPRDNYTRNCVKDMRRWFEQEQAAGTKDANALQICINSMRDWLAEL